MTHGEASSGSLDEPRGRRLAVVSLAALGVVFGDIGTSPLYAVRECFAGEYGIAPTPANVLGVLSLMTWSLLLVVSLKYLGYILRADNDGEGGIIALMAQTRATHLAHGRSILIAMGVFGASLLYGDGMITPAISVLSAVEGLGIAAPALLPYVLPLTIAILVALFAVQSRGTARIGAVFGPVMLLWFAVLAVLGVAGVVRAPEVLGAIAPWHAIRFFIANGWHGFVVLGAVFLVVTGAEALFADLGHFGRRPIRVAWYALVLPSLLLNYHGQGALLMRDASAAEHPFFSLAPAWAEYPLVGLATVATVIASQAVITGAFSLTRQAIQLGLCPRLRVRHTSADAIGQIYVPHVNWILMVSTVILVLGFGSSTRLAAAYGVAVTTTMIIASLLFYFVARDKWGWSAWKAGTPVALFLCADLAFFSANIGKIAHGAWFPLVIAVAVYLLFSTWDQGRAQFARSLRDQAMPLSELRRRIEQHPPLRVPGRAVFMTADVESAPAALLHNLAHNKVLHEEVVIFAVVIEDIPRVARERRVESDVLGDGFFRVVARFGFMEEPHVPRALLLARPEGTTTTVADTSFFLARERFLPRDEGGLSRWRGALFSFLSRNAVGATEYFHIPPERVIELGAQVSL